MYKMLGNPFLWLLLSVKTAKGTKTNTVHSRSEWTVVFIPLATNWELKERLWVAVDMKKQLETEIKTLPASVWEKHSVRTLSSCCSLPAGAFSYAQLWYCIPPCPISTRWLARAGNKVFSCRSAYFTIEGSLLACKSGLLPEDRQF